MGVFARIVVILAFFSVFVPGCGNNTGLGDGQDQDVLVEDGGGGSAGHTVNMGGVFHKSGKEDPLKNCVACHGAMLSGGAGPRCKDCHTNGDHLSSRGGYKHKSGSSTTCYSCHGSSNSGGIGPACRSCH